MRQDFGGMIDRRNTNCAKWDEMDTKYDSTDLVHLGVADMDFKAPKGIREAFSEIISHGVFGYTNLGDEFYSSIQRWLKKNTGVDIPKEWIVYCPRINVSSSMIINLLTEENEKVMIHAPYYMPLYQAIRKNGRGVVESPLKQDGDRYVIDFEQMEKVVDKETKILLCQH